MNDGSRDTGAEAGSIHGVAVAIGGAGVLLRGRSAAGKSRLAEELADAARRRGWFGRLVADDRVQVARRGGRLVLSPHKAIAGQVERRGQGIFAVEHEAAVVLRLVVDLVDRDRPADDPPRMPAASERQASISGVSIPRLTLAIGEPGAAQAVLELIDQLGA
ncbi:MAG: aldolase [Rhodoblastus sp.]